MLGALKVCQWLSLQRWGLHWLHCILEALQHTQVDQHLATNKESSGTSVQPVCCCKVICVGINVAVALAWWCNLLAVVGALLNLCQHVRSRVPAAELLTGDVLP